MSSKPFHLLRRSRFLILLFFYYNLRQNYLFWVRCLLRCRRSTMVLRYYLFMMLSCACCWVAFIPPLKLLLFLYICFDFRCAGETQLNAEKCMEKFKLWLDAFVCGYKPKILTFGSCLVTLTFSVHNFCKTRVLLLKIFETEFPYL